MTREKAIKWQEAFKKTYGNFPPEATEACDMAIEALQEPERKWIPVSERLPENYKEVLVQWEMINRVQNTVIVYTSVGLIDEHGEWVNSDVMRLFNGRIIAWHPLPEPYKAGEQE